MSTFLSPPPTFFFFIIISTTPQLPVRIASVLRMSTAQQANLLGIPTELRLAIYDAILDADVDCDILDKWDEGFEDRGFWSRPSRNEQTRLDLTWCNLLLTCRTIHTELESHMSKTRTGTYVAEIERNSHSITTFRWRRLDCAPRDVKSMIVEFKTEDPDCGFWGDGGPRPIVRELFQSLNLLLHCGPWLDVRYQLPELMHIGKLTIVPCFPALESGSSDWDPTYAMSGARSTYAQLRSFASTICQQGIAYGAVDKFEVTMGEETWEMEVKDCGRWEMPEGWRGYGFEWGLDQFREPSSWPES
ncbi:hypothetical protein CKM354_001011200 [Cercospora kikuchii]|uniref:Uncharacterized protein n=1 Tax=Cercospora kikuchii TaxID=84275 RepID=A0A9P3FKR1_9PEZI|nr:uncharacterized protein CKM354_001011200 [Cercospora kikuchii]GIZ47010.1 hypothetical protein CKM354_001011200 [Cercospora kikuchii]